MKSRLISIEICEFAAALLEKFSSKSVVIPPLLPVREKIRMYTVNAKNNMGKGETYFLRFPSSISTIIAPGRVNRFLMV